MPTMPETSQADPQWHFYLLFGSVSFALAWVTLYLSAQPGNLANLWFADILCTATLLHTPRRHWPLILLLSALAEWLARYITDTPALFGLALLPAHLFQSLVCVWLLRDNNLAFDFDTSPGKTLSLIGRCISLPPLAGASLLTIVSSLFYIDEWQHTLLAHYVGSAIGTVSFLPLMLLLSRGSLKTNLAQLEWHYLIPFSSLSLAVTLFAQLFLGYPFTYILATLIAVAMTLDVIGTTAIIWMIGFGTCITLSLGVFVQPPTIYYWQAMLVYPPILATLLSPLLLAVSRNHTRLKEEARILEAKKTEQLKSDFVSTVSHELRTPLTSVHGTLGLLANGVIPNLPEQAIKLTKLAYTNTNRLIHLINDLLDIQKLEAGKLVFHFETASVAVLLQDAYNSNQSYGTQFGVQIKLEPIAQNLQIHVDADRFHQIMNNLISNACKFSKTGDEVEIEVSTDTGKTLNITVIDHGSGIPESFRDKIFGKFSQLDSSDTKSKGGTGLGLSIAKAMAEQMQGQLTFQSQSGKGTRFILTLPYTESLPPDNVM